MEYVYATLLIESAGRKMTAERLTEVLEAANVDVDEKRIQALLSSWEQIEVDRDSYDPVEDEPEESPDGAGEDAPELEGDAEESPELEEGETPELDDGEETPELEEGADEEAHRGGQDIGKPGEKTSYGELRGLRMEADEKGKAEDAGESQNPTDNGETDEEEDDDEENE